MRDWPEILNNALLIMVCSAILGFIAMLMKDIVLSFFKRPFKKRSK